MRFAMFILVVSLSVLLLGCASVELEEAPPSPPGASEVATKTDFYDEVVDPNPRATSASFHDYDKKSYHVNKLEFWREFPDHAQASGRNLRSIVVFGPSSPLWAYHIFAFFDEGDRVRVNQVVFPHSRLTHKGTGVLSVAKATEFTRGLCSYDFAQPVESPNALSTLIAENEAAVDATRPLGDFLYDLLAVDFGSSGEACTSGWIRNRPRQPREAMYKNLNELADQLQATYEHGDPVPQ